MGIENESIQCYQKIKFVSGGGILKNKFPTSKRINFELHRSEYLQGYLLFRNEHIFLVKAFQYVFILL